MSISFDTGPVRRSRGPDRAALLAVGLAAFVVLAVLKPWQAEAPPSAVAPSAGPPSAAARLASPRPSPTPSALAARPSAVAFTPTVDSIVAVVARRGRGVFSVDALGRATVVATRGVRPLDRRRALLVPDEATTGRGPRIASLPDPAPTVLGVTLPRGSVLQAASLWATAPGVRALDAVVHVGRSSATIPADARPLPELGFRRRGFVAFSRPDGGAWNAGAYRITVRYWDPDYRLQEWSWHLDVGRTRPDPLVVSGAREAMLAS